MALKMLPGRSMTESECRDRLDAVQQELEQMTVEFEKRRARVATALAKLEETLRLLRRRQDEYDRVAA
jgi:hypothetical protein